MMYSLKICQHLTFRSNTNTHESEREPQNSVFLISDKTTQLYIKKNLIENLPECKLNLVGANGCYTLQSERGGIKLKSTWVTLLLPYCVWPWETEGGKTFALGNERREALYRENNGIQLAAATPLVLLH